MTEIEGARCCCVGSIAKSSVLATGRNSPDRRFVLNEVEERRLQQIHLHSQSAQASFQFPSRFQSIHGSSKFELISTLCRSIGTLPVKARLMRTAIRRSTMFTRAKHTRMTPHRWQMKTACRSAV